ncbi:MAG: SPOR domain-containing protein [Rhodospirillales bacterium]|nr:SPOR domain-containing protein [Rhodospirillales bacterium]
MSGGEDGSETPSASETPPAPESPEEETPAAPQEPVEQAGEGRAESRRPRLLPVWILLGAAVLAGGAWAVTERVGGGGGPPPDEASVPLITASAEPWKVRPDDPGGLKIPNQGTLIYETLSTAEPEEAPERVLPPPEEPLAPPKPEPDSAEALAVAGSGADAAVAALQPDTGGVEDPVLSPTTGKATPPEPEAPTEPVSLEEAPPLEPDGPPEFAAVEEALPLDLEISEIDGVLLPPPPKPGTLAAILAEEARQSELDEPATVEVPTREAEPPSAVEPTPELEADTLALVEEVLQRDSGSPAASPQAEEADPVPLPPYKPRRLARAEPAREGLASPATDQPRAWRYVQLGTANARSPLETLWETLRRRHDDALTGLSPLIMPVDRGDNGIFYRLRAGPLTDVAAAQRVCERLKARGRDCFVARD